MKHEYRISVERVAQLGQADHRRLRHLRHAEPPFAYRNYRTNIQPIFRYRRATLKRSDRKAC